jgi:hypothetical protein
VPRLGSTWGRLPIVVGRQNGSNSGVLGSFDIDLFPKIIGTGIPDTEALPV